LGILKKSVLNEIFFFFKKKLDLAIFARWVLPHGCMWPRG
jgi:hypothetical protein